MSRAITASEKDWARIAEMLRQWEGAPQLSQRQRGRWPLGDDGGAVQLAYITQDNGSGDNQYFFTSIVGGTEPFTCSKVADGTGTDFDVYWSHDVPGVHFTGQCIWIRRMESPLGNERNLQVVLEGVSAWHGVTATDGDIENGAGHALLRYWRCSPAGVYSLDYCKVPVVAGDTTFFVSESSGQLCDVEFDQATGLFYVTGVYCPGGA